LSSRCDRCHCRRFCHCVAGVVGCRQATCPTSTRSTLRASARSEVVQCRGRRRLPLRRHPSLRWRAGAGAVVVVVGTGIVVVPPSPVPYRRIGLVCVDGAAGVGSLLSSPLCPRGRLRCPVVIVVVVVVLLVKKTYQRPKRRKTTSLGLFFSFALPPRCFPLVSNCPVVPFGLVAALPLSRCFEVAPAPTPRAGTRGGGSRCW
jgi:hypothetical protein